MTLVRMLISVHFAGFFSLYDTTRNYQFPAVLAFIGYDPAEDHTGDTTNPVTDQGFDWLYTESFRLQFTGWASPGGTSTGIIFGGTDNPVSVEGQRKFGASHVPFFGLRQLYAPAEAPELWITSAQIWIRALVEDHGL
jgi:hypothetical protein